MSLKCVADKISLEKLKKDRVSGSIFNRILLAHLKCRKSGASEHLKKLACDNTVLTEDKIKLVAETCAMLSNMGLVIGEDPFLQVCNEIVAQRIEMKDFVPVTRGIVTRIILKNKDLLRLIRGNSIDPKRAQQENVDVRNVMFVRLENMVKLLYSHGKSNGGLLQKFHPNTCPIWTRWPLICMTTRRD